MPARGAVAFLARLEMTDPHLGRRGLAVPAEVAVLLTPEGPPGRRLPVRGEVNGVPFHTTLALRDDGVFILTLNAALRSKASLELGQTCRVTLAPDLEPLEVEPAADLRAALRASPRATAAFAALDGPHQKRYLDRLDRAKRPETRARRIEELLGALVEEPPDSDEEAVPEPEQS
jgi:hypothetical protein